MIYISRDFKILEILSEYINTLVVNYGSQLNVSCINERDKKTLQRRVRLNKPVC